jgi:hypothetical protein
MRGPKDPTPVFRQRYTPIPDPEIQVLPPAGRYPTLMPEREQIWAGQFRGDDTHTGIPLPSMKKGGVVPKTGAYMLHKGERVVPVRARKATATARPKKR